MTAKELKDRTALFARCVVEFCAPLFDRAATRSIADQLLRSGTAVDANYGSAQCARSPTEFVARIGLVVDDVNEAKGWVELIRDSGVVVDSEELQWLVIEASELTKILVSSYGTAKRNQEQRKRIEGAKRKGRRGTR
ncbi:MAG: four helix bundle protein [Vicinamibacterales bacterium]